jgi:hypothetical protein
MDCELTDSACMDGALKYDGVHFSSGDCWYQVPGSTERQLAMISLWLRV